MAVTLVLVVVCMISGLASATAMPVSDDNTVIGPDINQGINDDLLDDTLTRVISPRRAVDSLATYTLSGKKVRDVRARVIYIRGNKKFYLR